jgi:hypothetical protein
MGPHRTIGFTPIATILSDYLVEHRLRGAEGLVFGRDGSATIDDSGYGEVMGKSGPTRSGLEWS